MGASASLDDLKGDNPRILEAIRLQLKSNESFKINSKFAILKLINHAQLWSSFLAFEAQSFALTKTELKSLLLASFTSELPSEK